MLNKAIEHGKEHRQPYYDSRRFDTSCRNHGSCDYCLANRLYRRRVQEEATLAQFNTALENLDMHIVYRNLR